MRGFLLVTLLVPLLVAAAPLVLEETAQIAPPPEPGYAFPVDVAIDGDWLIAGGYRYLHAQPTAEENTTWLYQRQANGSWALQGQLHTFVFTAEGDEPPLRVAMQGGVAVILKENLSWISSARAAPGTAYRHPSKPTGWTSKSTAVPSS